MEPGKCGHPDGLPLEKPSKHSGGGARGGGSLVINLNLAPDERQDVEVSPSGSILRVDMRCVLQD